MESLSRIVTIVIDLLVRPFGPERHTLGLVWLSLLSGAGMALVFRATARAEAVRAAKARFRSYIYEMRIYKDSPRAVSGAFAGSLRANVSYLRAVLPSLLILAVPVIILIGQLDARYGAGHLHAGDTTVITAMISGAPDTETADATLACGSGARVDAGPVRIPGAGEISWRVRIEERGTHDATIATGRGRYTFRLVAEPAHWIIGRTKGEGPLAALLHPGMPPLPDGSKIERLEIDYPGASYPLLLWRVHWLVIFLVYAAVGALAVKAAIGFEI